MPKDTPPLEVTMDYGAFLRGDGEDREDDRESERLERERAAKLAARQRNRPGMKPYLP